MRRGVVLFLIAIFSIILIVQSYWIIKSKGGRWDLIEQIACSDRLQQTGNIFPNYESEPFEIATLYNPGTVLLTSIFGKNTNTKYQFMLILSVILVFVLILILSFITTWLFPNVEFHFALLIILFLHCISLTHYKTYAFEFKPDTIAIIFGLGGYMLFWKFLKSSFIWQFLLSGLFLIISFYFKQHAFVFAFIFSIIILSKLKYVITNLKLLITSLFLIAIFLFPFYTTNFAKYCITEMGRHPILWIQNSQFFLTEISVDFPIFILIFLSIIYYLTQKKLKSITLKNIVTNSYINIHIQYFILAVTYGSFCILGSLLWGGTIGNVQVAYLLFLPMIVNFLINGINFSFLTNNDLKTAVFSSCFILFIPYSIKPIFKLKTVAKNYAQSQQKWKIILNSIENKNQYLFIKDEIYIPAKNAGFSKFKSLESIVSFYEFNETLDVAKLLENEIIQKQDIQYICANSTLVNFFEYHPKIQAVIDNNYILDSLSNPSLNIFIYKRKLIQ